MDKKQQELDTIHNRVTEWSEKWEASGSPTIDPEDPEFVDIITSLMEMDQEDLLVLMGRAAIEAGLTEDLLSDAENDEGYRD